MSWELKWIWNPETPARVPAGARISEGKSGKVARSFPTLAVVSVNWEPVSCIPSPESPTNRMVTSSCLMSSSEDMTSKRLLTLESAAIHRAAEGAG